MNKKEIFETILIPVPSGLEEKILLRIREKERAKIKRGFIFGCAGALLGLASFVPTAVSLSAAAAKSGFFQTFSLLFSDSGTVMKFLSDFIYSLLDSVPFTETLVFLAVVLVLIVSARAIFMDSKKLFGKTLALSH
jgi:hypothetical protein